jgi:hypothetical protein
LSTTSDYRRIGRWEREAVLDKMHGRLDANRAAMQMRRQTVEHSFGTIKAWMGATRFLCRGLPRVSAEMSLRVLAYNLKRVMARARNSWAAPRCQVDGDEHRDLDGICNLCARSVQFILKQEA